MGHLRKEKRVDKIEIQKFISKKADLLFAISWKSDAPTSSEVTDDNDSKLLWRAFKIVWFSAEGDIIVVILNFFSQIIMRSCHP